MHEITVREDGTIDLTDAAVLCGVRVDAIRKRVRRRLLREVRREKGRVLVYLLDVARLDSVMQVRREGRIYAEVTWRLEGEPDVDILSVFRACEDAVARQMEAPQRESIVYYARFGDRVKIGTTICLAARLDSVPHDEVLATEPGGWEVEQQRHMQFVEHWITGEWFRLVPEIIRHAAALAEKFPQHEAAGL